MKIKTSIILVLSLILMITMLFVVVSADPYEPKQIRVRMDDGSILTPYFEDYVKEVLPNEMYSNWSTSTLRAGATAARTFGWYHCNNPLGSTYDVTEWSQRYISGSSGQSVFDSAVNYTQGWRLEYSSSPIYARYQAETGNPTKDSLYDRIVQRSYAYLKPVQDSHTTTSSSYSGMCQNGAKAMGANSSTPEAILSHYYTGISIQKSSWVFKYEYTTIGSSYYRIEWWKNSGTSTETTKQYIKVGII